MMVVSVEHRTHVIRLAVYFSSANSITSSISSHLSFQFSRDTTIPSAVKVSVLKVVNSSALPARLH